jgi:hypothetical protein
MPREGTRAGGVAQLVEHLVCNQAVVGSNPVASTSSLDRRRPLGRKQNKLESAPRTRADL